MSTLKKASALLGLLALAVASAAVYWNMHLFYRARDRTDGAAEKEILLERAAAWYPWNDQVDRELGAARFRLAMDNLTDVAGRDARLTESRRSTLRSLRLNPASIEGHFELAQTLLYLSYLAIPAPGSWFEEYKKAALLAGHNTQVRTEVGKVLLSRWDSLTAAEKDFTFGLLAGLLTGRDTGRFQDLLQVWDLHVRDYTVVDRILPEDAVLYRYYADFLAGRGLSLAERWAKLARAEALEFDAAREAYERGRRALEYFRLPEAKALFEAGLNELRGIRFYQALAGQSLIDQKEYSRTEAAFLLGLAMVKVEETGALAEARPWLDAYLTVQSDVPDLAALERNLKERALLPPRPSLETGDLETLAFHLLLGFKQNKYRELVAVGNALARSFVAVPETKKKAYAQVLCLIGDAYQKLDYIYESGKFYNQALDADPGNLPALFGLRRSLERLNDEEHLQALRPRLERVLTPSSSSPGDTVLPRAKGYVRLLVLEGKRVALTLIFAPVSGGLRPVVSIVLNGRVAWEGDVSAGAVSVTLETLPGRNELLISPQNADVVLRKVLYAPVSSQSGSEDP